jgi:Ser/Thr protein kinase RdoA (MazF antagonist)
MNPQKLLKTVSESLATNYGIQGELERLPGENLNFLVTQSDGTKHVLKIVDEHMPPSVVEMEHVAIEHALRAGFQPRLPRIIETLNANIECRIDIHKKGLYRSRLIAFIPGIEMSNLSDISENLLYDLGKTIADFNLAMRGFDHPAAHRRHRWNLAEAEQHESKIALIDEAGKQQLLQWAFTLWRGSKDALAAVPWQFIHGDAHDENVLVEGDRVIGLIDFGDCCYNPTVCDLAICLTYLMMRGDDPLRLAAKILDGYVGVRPLASVELDLLYPLVCARLAVSVCVANKRKTIDPDNPNWFGGEGSAWRMLRWLQDTGRETFDSGLRAACAD